MDEQQPQPPTWHSTLPTYERCVIWYDRAGFEHRQILRADSLAAILSDTQALLVLEQDLMADEADDEEEPETPEPPRGHWCGIHNARLYRWHIFGEERNAHSFGPGRWCDGLEQGDVVAP